MSYVRRPKVGVSQTDKVEAKVVVASHAVFAIEVAQVEDRVCMLRIRPAAVCACGCSVIETAKRLPRIKAQVKAQRLCPIC
jgi:hypothetical protein